MIAIVHQSQAKGVAPFFRTFQLLSLRREAHMSGYQSGRGILQSIARTFNWETAVHSSCRFTQIVRTCSPTMRGKRETVRAISAIHQLTPISRHYEQRGQSSKVARHEVSLCPTEHPSPTPASISVSRRLPVDQISVLVTSKPLKTTKPHPIRPSILNNSA